MNAIYKVIYNASTQTFQAVSELGKSHQRSAQKTTGLAKAIKALDKAKSLLALSVALILSHTAIAAPTGGQVVAGQASINQTALTTNITQSSQNAAINWQQFNIAPQETVNFNQPNANAITLNRVLGNETSVLDGVMNANGKVFISNPDGILIGKNATINVGSLLATTAPISNDDFMAGRYRFGTEVVRDGTGKITQLGSITVPKGGSVALVAPIVDNQGSITAPQGNVLLASAAKFRVTLDGETLGYTLDKGVLEGLVDNGGMIVADGGVVVVTSLGLDTLKKSLIKHSGVIQANTVANKNGRIELLGDLDNSRLELSGTLTAEAKDGDGGFVETSAARLDIKDTAHVSTTAQDGKTGTWVIDPQDFTVAPTGGDMTGGQVSTALQNNNVTLKSIDGKTEGNGDVIINDTITWDNNTLTLNAQNDIHINKTMTGTGTAKLALEYGQASTDGTVAVVKNGKQETQDNDYHLDKDTPLASRTVKINLPAGQTFSTKKGVYGDVEVFEVIHQMPDIVKNSDDEWESKFTTRNIALGADIDVSHTRDYEGFAGWQLSDNRGRVHGLGHTVDRLTIRGSKDNRSAGLFRENYSFNNENAIRNIGVTNVDVQTTGELAHAGGLLGYGDGIYDSYATGNVATTGHYARAGGLVGGGYSIYNSYATVKVLAIGDGADAGGLAGKGSTIHNSYATGSVSTTGAINDTGGLVGTGNNIHNSYATGSVSTQGSYANAGGLLGDGDGIYDSYATGNVATTGHYARAGGLVGSGSGIHNSYANNNSIIATGDDNIVGGLVGYYSHTDDNHNSKNTIFNSTKHPTLSAIGRYADDVDKSKITNLTGKTDTELKQKSTFEGWDFDTVWRISEGSDYPRLRALTEGVVTVTPATGKDLRIRGVNLTKRYNGEPIITFDELTSLEGWRQDGVLPIGLAPNDSLSDPNIFTGKITLGGTWQGAVDAGEYSIIPSGLQSQKYEIRYEAGKLTIAPIVLSAIGTRPYNALSTVTADKHTKLVGNILPKDQGKLTATGSSKITIKQSNRFVDATDVGTYELVGGDLIVSNKNYIINPALSRWTITPKSIALTGNAQSKTVTADDVNLNRLGIEPQDTGAVKLVGKGTLGNNNKLANHSFTLVGDKAKNYTLDTSKAWTPTSDTPQPRPPIDGTAQQIAAIEQAIGQAQQARQEAVKALINAKNHNLPFDESYNQSIIRAKNQARLLLAQLSDTVAQKTALLNRLDDIKLIGGYTPSSSVVGGGTGGARPTPPVVDNSHRPTVPTVDTPTRPTPPVVVDNASRPDDGVQAQDSTDVSKPLDSKFIGQIEAERAVAFLRENNVPTKTFYQNVMDLNQKSCEISQSCITQAEINRVKIINPPEGWSSDMIRNMEKAIAVLNNQSDDNIGVQIFQNLMRVRSYSTKNADSPSNWDFVQEYTKNIDGGVILQAGTSSISIKDYIASTIEREWLLDELSKTKASEIILKEKIGDLRSSNSTRVNAITSNADKIERQMKNLKDINNRLQKEKRQSFFDILTDNAMQVGDALNVGSSGLTAMVWATKGLTLELAESNTNLRALATLSSIKDLNMAEKTENLNKAANFTFKTVPNILANTTDMIGGKMGIDEFLNESAHAVLELNDFSKILGELSVGQSTLAKTSKIVTSVQKIDSYAKSIKAIDKIPEKYITKEDKLFFSSLYEKQISNEVKDISYSFSDITVDLSKKLPYVKKLPLRTVNEIVKNSTDVIIKTLDLFGNIKNREMGRKMINIKKNHDTTRLEWKQIALNQVGITQNLLILNGEQTSVLQTTKGNQK